jgi:hypothetical protein
MRPSASRHVRALLWREWCQHGGILLGFASAWLIGGWIVLLFFHPAWLLALGCIYAVAAAGLMAGADTVEGSEEFVFALPPTRKERFLVRLSLAGLPLAAMLGIGLPAIALDLPQRLWGLVVESGFTEPFPPCEPAWYAASAVIPLALFACAFVRQSLARSREEARATAVLFALRDVFVVFALGFLVEGFAWKRWTFAVSGTALALTALATLALGYRSYLRKEGVSRPGRAPSGNLWIWLLALLLLAVIVLFIA